MKPFALPIRAILPGDTIYPGVTVLDRITDGPFDAPRSVELLLDNNKSLKAPADFCLTVEEIADTLFA